MGYFKDINTDFKKNWKNHLFQNLLIVLYIIVIFHFHSFFDTLLASSLGASAFIVFAMPNSQASKSKNLLFSYVICAFLAFLGRLLPIESEVIFYLIFIFLIGLSFFCMTVFNFEHPPAIGLSISVFISPDYKKVIIFSLSSVLFLAFIRIIFKKRIKDLV